MSGPKTEHGKARKLFLDFHGVEPDVDDIARLVFDPDTVLLVGELEGVIYIAKGDQKRYIHQFNKKNRPALYVSSDGKQAFILGGGYVFTDRGFEG